MNVDEAAQSARISATLQRIRAWDTFGPALNSGKPLHSYTPLAGANPWRSSSAYGIRHATRGSLPLRVLPGRFLLFKCQGVQVWRWNTALDMLVGS